MPDFENKIDLKKLQQIAKKTKVLIKIGYTSGMQHTSVEDAEGKTKDVPELAELAKRLTYGDGNLPPRPFLEEGIASGADKIASIMKTQLEKVHNDLKPNWGLVGSVAVGSVKEFVMGDYYQTHVPNSPRTIEAKSKDGKISDKPLIDTGNLINSLLYVVEGDK